MMCCQNRCVRQPYFTDLKAFKSVSFFSIDFPLTFIDLGNLLELTLLFPVISVIICHVHIMSFWKSLGID